MNLSHQSSGSNQSEYYVSWSSSSLVFPSAEDFSICKTTQACGSEIVIYVLQRGAKDSVAII